MADPSLRDYVDIRLVELDKRVSDRFAAQELAIGKAEAALEARLVSMNEFRAQLTDQSKHFITRMEHDKLDNDVRALQNDKANLDGRMLVAVVITSALLSVIVSGLLILVAHFFPVGP